MFDLLNVISLVRILIVVALRELEGHRILYQLLLIAFLYVGGYGFPSSSDRFFSPPQHWHRPLTLTLFVRSVSTWEKKLKSSRRSSYLRLHATYIVHHWVVGSLNHSRRILIFPVQLESPNIYPKTYII